MKQVIRCASCGEIIGQYSVFSHAHDECDSGDPAFNASYGGAVDGERYCTDCHARVMWEYDNGTAVPHNRGRSPAAKPWPGLNRGWGPLTRNIEGEGMGAL
jgi:hypothetical protein